MTMLPIVFIHNHNSHYLPLSLWQARKSNPGSEVILIGDSYSAHFGFMVRHEDKKNYFQGASEFAKRFKNFSTNPHDFELICLQRWFILEEFMLINGLKKCLYLDSDILLYGNVSEDSPRFSSFGMTIAGISGHSNFVHHIDTLSDFCRFLMDSYKDEAAIQVLEEKYREFRKKHAAGGISDMTFFMEYKEIHPDRILNIGFPLKKRLYDISMNHTEGVESKNGIKVVRKAKNGNTYLQYNNGLIVQIQTLHFQGETKVHMKRHMFSRSITLNVLYHSNRLILLAQKVWRKLFGRN